MIAGVQLAASQNWTSITAKGDLNSVEALIASVSLADADLVITDDAEALVAELV